MKVYVTGMGTASSLGNGVETMFSALLAGQTGVKAFPEWEQHRGLFARLGAPAAPYDISKIPRSARRTMSRMSEMAVVATLEALEQAQLQIPENQSCPRVLMIYGSTTGSPDTLETYFKKLFERGGPEGQLGTTFFKAMNHSVQANVASAFGFLGPSLAPASACATSAQAMILGWELLQTGLYDIVIAGGADELHYTSSSVFDIVQAASRAYNDQPSRSPRPFDLKRDGLVVSEGSSVVVLESEASVGRRKVPHYAELRGGSYFCDGSHMTQPNAASMIETMKTSLARAGLSERDIGYVNAHATGTVQGDAEEASAIGQLFGPEIPVSSLKGHFGHSLAACGTLEAICSIKMMEKGVLIPTRNLETIDPSCAGVRHVREAQPVRIRHTLSNNFAFGGINTSLVLSMGDE